jgi:hypothetical protein
MGQKFKDFSFAKTVLVTSIVFLVIVIIIEFLYSLTVLSFDDALLNMYNSKYIIRKLIAALIYGIIMTFYFKRKRKKTK